MAAATTGRAQAAASAAAQVRAPDLSRFYRFKAPPITPGDFTFMLDLLRPRQAPLSLDRMVDTLGWDDEQSTLTGSLTAFRPKIDDPRSLPITRGMMVRCRVRWAGGTYQLWTMRTQAPQTEVETGNVTIPLIDDMVKLDTGKRDWWFRKTKHRPFGYTCDEIGHAVAATLGVKVRVLAKGTHRFELKMRHATGLAVLRQAYANEKAKAGRSFVLRLRNGELEVVPLARNPVLYVLAAQIQTALITQKGGSAAPTTVLTGRGRIGHGKHTVPVSYTEFDRGVVNLLGYVHDTKDFGRVDSHSDLRDQVKRELAKRLRFNDTITIQHQGIPFILRGDGAQVGLPSEGYGGANSFVFCTRANHTVQSGVYTTQWDFTSRDPFLAQLRSDAKAAAARAAKRKQRSRPKLKKAR